MTQRERERVSGIHVASLDGKAECRDKPARAKKNGGQYHRGSNLDSKSCVRVLVLKPA